MARFIAATLLAAFLMLKPGDAEASEWMYRRSWFSDAPGMRHSAGCCPEAGGQLPPHAVPEPRSARRPAIPQRGPGFSIRTKQRYNYFRLFNGRSTDTTVFREFSFEVSP